MSTQRNTIIIGVDEYRRRCWKESFIDDIESCTCMLPRGHMSEHQWMPNNRLQQFIYEYGAIMDLTHVRKDVQYHYLMEQAMQRFAGTGVTHDGTIADNSSRVLPEPTELAVRTTNLGVEIIRRMGGQEGEEVVVAQQSSDFEPLVGTPDLEISTYAAWWLQAYTQLSRPFRALMLDVLDPIHWSALEIEATLDGRLKEGQLVLPKQSSLNAPNEYGAQVGMVGERKRVMWNGHSGFGLARWMGAAGWSSKQALGVFLKLGIEMGTTAVTGGVYAGKSGKRGDPAPVTAAQAQTLATVLQELYPTDPVPVPALPEAILRAAGGNQHMVVKVALDPLAKARARRDHDDKLLGEIKKRKAAGVRRK